MREGRTVMLGNAADFDVGDAAAVSDAQVITREIARTEAEIAALLAEARL
jgi:hypothetical protein